MSIAVINEACVGVATDYNGIDKSKEWQMELLMEKLRSKGTQLKTFTETSKNVRMAMLDKRYSLDSVEKAQHQRCLDTLQHCIKVTSLQSMIERLESLTRQLSLNFMVGPSGVELFISSDMFYLEIVLDPSGAVKDVKVHHEGKMEQQSCAELVNCLSRGDFADFTAQLEGFASIYQLEIEKKIKCKAFTALQSLETDLYTLAQLQTFIQEPSNLLHKSPVGILQKRRGGHAMKLTYFVSPYDLLDKEKSVAEPLSVDVVTDKSLGYSVTVCMEGSAVHKLQTATIISVNRNPNGKNTPSYASLGNQNSAQISACFVLRLNKPLPMCVCLVKKIQQITDLTCGDQTTTHPLLSLITQHCSDGQLDATNNKGLFVTLPDQHHCYFMTENKNMDGLLIKSIPFTHPAHVPPILVLLRQQALFNTVVSSCIRPWSKQDFESMIMFEITALSWQHVSISLEHPIEETMATAELDLSDISNVNCRIFSSGGPLTDAASESATKVFQMCLSIPITMRSVIKLWDTQVRKNNHNENENFSLPLGAGDPGGHGGPGGNGDNNCHQNKTEGSSLGQSMGQMGGSMTHPHQGMFLNETMMAGGGFNPFPSHQALSNMELTNILAGTSSGNADKAYNKRHHKRKSSGDLWKGSSKRKAGGDDTDVLLESSSSDSTSRSTPISHETSEVPTPNSGLGFHSDLELSGLDTSDVLPEKTVVSDVDDVDDALSGNKEKTKKPRSERKSPSASTVLLDFGIENKTLVPPSVSITPITSSASQSTTFNSATMGLDRRPGIEIIPISSAPPTSLPSSITITPISSSQMKAIGEERSKEKKSSKSSRSSDDKSRLEKKRKRKRDEGPMGPPEKVPPKNDPLSKPVSVSIRAAESPPLPTVSPTSPSSVMRKFNASPTHSRGLSPSLLKPMGKTGSTHHSPKHSPAHGISSPKNHGTSPKHPSTGTGKPSISTLKSAANSPSSKTNDTNVVSRKVISKDGASRDKESKKSSVFNVSPSKNKPSSTKLKPADASAVGDSSAAAGGQSGCDSEPSPSAGGLDAAKSSSLNQLRNRKGSLSAVIDKLKNAQHCGSEPDVAKSSGNRDARGPNKTVESKGKVGDGKNSEYMVKASSDAMKITINKTRSKESSKSTSGLSKSQSYSSGTGSPKTHTGLKPGVNSGPASKKPQQVNQKSSSVVSNSTGSYGGNSSSSSGGGIKNSGLSSKPVSFSGSKNVSSGSVLSKSMSKLSGSPKSGNASATDLSRTKDRPRLNKGSEKSSLFSNATRKSSPTSSREETDSERAYKIFSKMDTYPSSLVEGLIKQLDTKFQIPKLSARTADGDKKVSGAANKVNATETPVNNLQRTDKLFDLMTNKTDVPLPKYNIAKSLENVDPKNVRNSSTMVSATPSAATNSVPFTGSVSPKTKKDYLEDGTSSSAGDFGESTDSKSQGKSNVVGYSSTGTGKDDTGSTISAASSKSYPATITAAVVTTPSVETLNLSVKSSDCVNKFVVPQQAKYDDKKPTNEHVAKLGVVKEDGGDLLLDFSASGKSSSPLNAIDKGVVKTPSPIVQNATSHTITPSCITDDELMDEALLGIGK